MHGPRCEEAVEDDPADGRLLRCRPQTAAPARAAMNRSQSAPERFCLLTEELEAVRQQLEENVPPPADVAHAQRHLVFVDEQHLGNLYAIANQRAETANAFGLG